MFFIITKFKNLVRRKFRTFGNDKIEGTPLEKLKVKKIVCIREEIYKKIKEDVKKYKLINPVKIRTKKTKKRNNYESSFILNI